MVIRGKREVVTSLREFLFQRKYTVARLAQELGLQHETLRAVVQEHRPPTLYMALRIAEHFGVPVNAMWELRSRVAAEANKGYGNPQANEVTYK